MHSFQTSNGNSYLHSGDFSGQVTCPDGSAIPFRDMVELVAECKRRMTISDLEQATPEEILGVKP